MIKKILFPVLLVLGVVIGGVAADFLRSKSAGGGDAHAESVDSHGKKAKDSHGKKADKGGHGKKADKGGHGKKADKGGHGKKDDGHGKKKKKKKKGGHGADDGESSMSSAISYLKFKRQFVVPVVKHGNIEALVLLNLNLELVPDAPEDSHTYEPKLRDALMRTLLALAHEGVFTGDLTDPETYEYLQSSMLQATKSILSDNVRAVLILDLTRQEQR